MSEKNSSASHNSGRLAARRHKKRQRVLIAFFACVFLVCCGLVWCFWQNSVRISQVKIFGADQSLATVALSAMQGKYLGVIPHDSTFFFPASRIRTDMLAAHPDVAAVSLFRNGLTGLSIKVTNRVPIASWCGSSFATSSPIGDCYLFDTKGFIFQLNKLYKNSCQRRNA